MSDDNESKVGEDVSNGDIVENEDLGNDGDDGLLIIEPKSKTKFKTLEKKAGDFSDMKRKKR